MLVPRTRLLLWAAIVLLPFGTLAGIDPAARAVGFTAIGLFALLVAIDAALAPRRLGAISIVLPDVTRMSQDRPGSIPIRIHNPSQAARLLRVGLQFPAALQADDDDTVIAVPAGAESSEFGWPVRPAQRGKFMIVSARLEAVSPLGLWAFWRTEPVAGEVRVYPNLARERKNLAALFLNRGTIGLHAQRMVGKGRDFEKLRDYIPGDSFDEIHWKATAKRGHPVTKVFQIERTQEIYVIIDASRLSARPVMTRGPANTSPLPQGEHSPADPGASTAALERFITAALVLGLAAEHQGDLFGLLTFSDRIETFLRARNGKAHYHTCRDALYTLQPRDITPDFDELSAFIRLRLRRRAMLFILTSLDDPVLAESFVKSVELISRQHVVLVNMLQPRGVAPLFGHANVTAADELYEQLGAHLRWQRLRELERVLQRRGARFALLPSERLAVDLVSQYVNVKQRQLL